MGPVRAAGRPHSCDDMKQSYHHGPVLRRWFLIEALLGACCLFVASITGCGGAVPRHTQIPTEIPKSVAAVVGAVSIHVASVLRWEPPANKAMRRKPVNQNSALEQLIEGQWILQQADAEGINQEVVNRLIRKRAAADRARSPQLGVKERRLHARIDIVTEALRQRHSHSGGTPSEVEIKRYYRKHRASFTIPPIHHTLMVVNPSRTAILRARAALERGENWRRVASRWSKDSSSTAGGAYAVVQHIAPPRIVKAAFTSPHWQIVGPLRAKPVADPSHPTYYLFEVTSAEPGRTQTLSQAKAQIRGRIERNRRSHSLAAYWLSFERRWRAQTLCAPKYVVPQCRNYVNRQGPK